MSDSPEPWVAADAVGATRLHAPATLRNRAAIADTLGTILPDTGLVLEVASGSGEHCAFFAERFDRMDWQPSDPDASARASIASWCGGLGNVATPIELDVTRRPWPIDRADAILCINMVHIAPWEACVALMAGAGRLLDPHAPLILYGPFLRPDAPTAPSNLAFDASLKARDPRWGLRGLPSVTHEASLCGLDLDSVREMPANNLLLVYRRAPETATGAAPSR